MSRVDTWTKDEDLLLSETVLRHIRQGSTQLKAFDEVGEKLNRTSAGCAFRWNGIVRNNYTEAILFAKKLRNDGKRRGKTLKAPKVPKAPKQLEAALEVAEEVKPQIIVKEVPKEIEKMDVIGYLLDLMNESENEPVTQSIKNVIKYMVEPKKSLGAPTPIGR